MSKYQLIFLIIIGLICNVKAQYVPYKHYTIAEGLPSTGIYSVFQDSKGYIWLGTKAGAARYDGRSFKCFDQNDRLPSPFIYGFKEDSKGRIWVSSSVALPTYYHNNKWNQLLIPFQSSTSNHKGLINSIVEDARGNIFLGCHSNEIIKIGKPSTPISIGLKIKLGLRKIIKHKEDSFLAITQDEIISYSNNFQTTNWSYKVKGQDILRCKKINQNVLFIVTTSSNVFFSIDEKKIISSYPNTKLPKIIFIGDQNTEGVLVGTRNGLFYTSHHNFIEHPLNKWLKGKAVSSILLDKEGGTWIATLNSGLYYFPKFLFNVYEAPTGSSFSIHEIKTNIDTSYFIGMNNGYYGFWDTKKEGFTTIDSIPFSNKVHSFFQFNRNEKWIFTDVAFQVQLANKKKYTIRHGSRDVVFHQKSNSFIFSHTNGVFAIPRDYLLDKVLLSKPEIVIHEEEDFILRQISDIGCHKLVFNEDELWMVGIDGLSKYSFITDSLRNLSREHAFIPKQLSSMFIINPNLITLGTYGEGVIIWNIKDDTFFHISEDQRLSNNYIRNLHLTDSTSLWVTHLEGVSKISIDNIDSINVQNYGFDDGLLLGEYYVINHNEDFLFIGTSNGMFYAPLEILDTERTKPDIKIEQILTDNKQVNLFHQEKVVQRSIIDELSISFSYINYLYGEEIKILYRLKGRDKSWRQAPGSQIQFSNLLPNKYHFEIKAVHPLGLESKTVSIPITVYKPFYNTLWFYLLGFLAIIVGVFKLFQLEILSFNIESIIAIFHKTLNIDHKEALKLTLKTVDGVYHKLSLEEILYIQATGNYTKVVCLQGSFLSRNTLKNLEKELAEQKEFQRVHRSFIINIKRIEKIMSNKIYIDSTEIPYSKSYKSLIDTLKQKIRVA